MHLELMQTQVHGRGIDDAPAPLFCTYVVLLPIVRFQRRVVAIVLVIPPGALT